MTDHKELVDRPEYVVEQLRLRAKFRDEYATPFDPNLDNAAARVIEEQAAEIARLRGSKDLIEKYQALGAEYRALSAGYDELIAGYKALSQRYRL